MTFEIGKDYVYVDFPACKFTLLDIKETSNGKIYVCREFNGFRFTFDEGSKYERSCKELIDKYKIVW